MLEFAVLGPLEIRRDGRAVPIAGPRRRALLAVLLLNEGQVVSLDRLIDAVWGDAAPASARAQVQSLVHGLRRALGEDGAGTPLIETRAPGYVLSVAGTASFDLAEFREHVERGRAAARAGETDTAAEAYRRALGLWRGPALEDIGTAFSDAVAARLEEDRLAVLEERLEADLALGRHGELVPELVPLTADHPLRERLRAQYMLALYRCGRQADALAVYARGRELLDDELGVRPGEELRRVHAAILAADPALSLAGPVAGEPAEAPPGPVVRPPARAAAPVRGRTGAASLVLGLLLVLLPVAVRGDASAPGAPGTPAPERGPSQQVLGPAWVGEPAAPVAPELFGVTLNSSSGAMPSFRVGAVRLWDSRTRWTNVEPRRGEFDWEILDRLVAGAGEERLPVLYTMGGTPGWAAPDAPRMAYDDGSRTGPPADPADWDEYVRRVAERYRGRIDAYELWNTANSPRFYTGDPQTLAALTERAARIIKAADPSATVVCPSMGELWDETPRRFLADFAAAGGYRHCDAAGVKLHQRNEGDAPETIVELGALIDRTFHQAGSHLPLWNTGTTYRLAADSTLGEEQAVDQAVRFYLVGLYLRYPRMYFYSWGGRRLPLVLQAEGGPPTRAALAVEELQRWLAGARIRSCGHGTAVGLPAAVWECRFLVRGEHGAQGEEAAIRWTDHGEAVMTAGPDAYRVDHLDGTTTSLAPGGALRIGERPVLVRHRAS
ncbi:BTAD domain-containing putative transcriptional regulator [Kitasatospora sp. NPDC058115]|uniref:BTAD domain-containing putative transcriptional regulator n=1 Tax=Kitasatospora sp. NPDC058115 TaxID=3346347 RepID=UPI0036D9AEEC